MDKVGKSVGRIDIIYVNSSQNESLTLLVYKVSKKINLQSIGSLVTLSESGVSITH